MVLKIYGVISILNIVLGEKLRYDLKKNTEFANKLKLTSLGKIIYNKYMKLGKQIIESILPIYNLFTLFQNSMFFIFSIFKDREGQLALLKAIDESENKK